MSKRLTLHFSNPFVVLMILHCYLEGETNNGFVNVKFIVMFKHKNSKNFIMEVHVVTWKKK